MSFLEIHELCLIILLLLLGVIMKAKCPKCWKVPDHLVQIKATKVTRLVSRLEIFPRFGNRVSVQPGLLLGQSDDSVDGGFIDVT